MAQTIGDLCGGDPATYRWVCKVLQLDREEWDRTGGPSRDTGRPAAAQDAQLTLWGEEEAS